MIWQDAFNSKGEAGALGADPPYDAQDTQITDLKIQADQVDGDRALVLITFKNFGEAKSLIFNVEREGGAWKVSNIAGDDYNLLETLQAAAKRCRDVGCMPMLGGRTRRPRATPTLPPTEERLQCETERQPDQPDEQAGR